ncbi:MAG TPA: glycosyltransferase family 2 protein [Ignavibacteriaceae bacterium]|nr:glycosyltransferase family 2 protein [Ignavibacteriaceae bacterium]
MLKDGKGYSINTENLNKVCAVIPFFNERKTLRKVVEKTLLFVNEVIAVNDGSTDGSGAELNDLKHVYLLNLVNNNGKGFALRAGFDECNKRNCRYIVTLDADLQHDPEFIPLLLKKTEIFDIVIGNRLNNVKLMPYLRRLSNRLTSFMLSKKTGAKIMDSQSGFRVYKAVVPASVKTDMNGFEAESEILVKALRQKFSVGFVDIPTIYGDEKSKMRTYPAIKGFIKVMMS